ncbi:MAG: TonB-dependent receptor [Acidobacteria bacterium]|nr:MAG: TonB-dependent receptor [Acidobacteriota bacterium]REK07332.1 MAG: TonB-dependent receptor [Acidobacteriota bacterium]
MKSAISRIGLVLVASLILALLPGSALGQTSGTIQGTITGANGESLPGVTVVVRNAATGAERTVVTDAQGVYRARTLPPGDYTVTASLEGMQTVRQEDVDLSLGAVLDVDVQLQVESTDEVITVTSEAPLIEVSRSSAASYVNEQAIETLPIVGRDFKDFALLTPTVQTDPVRGFVTVGGQRGIYTGLNIDGANQKSTFFGYGTGGEATENDGLVIAQDSVREFQVVTNEFSPEFGRSGGAQINVITQSGTNDLRGTAFYQFQNESMTEDIPSSPLDDFRGIDGSREVTEFDRDNYGVSIGGPIIQDRTHYFFTFDQSTRQEPFTERIRTRTNWSGCGAPGSLNCLSVYDAILQRAQSNPAFADLLIGFDRQPDGSAIGFFDREVDNLILFGKIDHQINDANTISGRLNITDFERTSSYLDEESLKTEETDSINIGLVSIIGDRGVNEFRINRITDDLNRASQRVGTPIEAQIRFRFGDFDSVGKFDFLPIIAEEEQLQIKNDFSYLFGEHDTKFGIDYDQSDLAQIFAGSKDGRYDYGSIVDFLNNNSRGARIYFGDVTFPNYDETQESYAIYAQDSWKRGDLTINYGLRYEAEINPDNLTHIFPEGRDIPDDDDNIAPRVGFAWSPNGIDVLRGGVGLFFGRTPTLLFASQIQENGLFPNFGRVFVRPGDPGFVQLGNPIPNENPPMNTIPSTSYVDPSYELPETWRLNLGYDRELGQGWLVGADFVYADGSNLQRNTDLNRTVATRDQFGRPVYSSTRPNPNLDTIFVRLSNGESEYTALTLKGNKRFNGLYSVNAHYTWSKDEDSDSNERSATSVTVTDDANPGFDFGLSDRDVEHRFLVHGLVQLPLGFQISGIYEFRSGSVYTALDANDTFSNYPAFNGPAVRAVVGGQLAERNGERNEDVSKIDLRLTKKFTFLERYEFDLYAEVFNLLDEHAFNVGGSQSEPLLGDGSPNPEFGIGSGLANVQRNWQFGARFSF